MRSKETKRVDVGTVAKRAIVMLLCGAAVVVLQSWGVAPPVLAASAEVAGVEIAPASAPEQQAEQGVVRPSGADLYDLPDGTVIDTLPGVSFVTIFGRSADSNWLVVSTATGASGWVQTAQVIAYNIPSLPVMEGGDAPAPSSGTATGGASTGSSVATPAEVAATVAPTATPTQPPTATPTLTPTATPSPTPLPTNTPTPVPPTATSVPTVSSVPTVAAVATRSTNLPTIRTPMARTSIVGVVNVQGATLASEPGLDDGDSLPAGSTVALVGRNEGGDWVLVQRNDGTQAWLPVTSIVAFGVGDLPVDDGSAVTEAVAALPTATVASDPASAVSATDVTTDTEATDAQPAATLAASEEASAADASANEDSATGPLATILMTGGRLNIRSGPGATFAIIGKALPDEQVVLLGRSEAADWLRIAQQGTDGATGWVSSDFIETTADLGALPIAGEEAETVEGVAPVATAAPVVAPVTEAAAIDAMATDAPTTDAPVSATPVPAVSVPAVPSSATVKTAATGLNGNIVFQDGRDGIWLYNLDSAEIRQLTTGFDPAFSPDGRTVAFVRGDGGNNGIYTIGVDGSNERKVWGEGEILRHPKFSPNGERIVFSRLIGEWKCFNTEFFGCITLRQLIAWFPAAAIPAVSRAILGDAERLSFPNWGISRVGINGDEFRDINALDSAIAPDWHNNGIVYQSKAGLEITTDTDDGQTRNVFHGGWDHDPDWQPNGDLILYQSREGSHWEIWRVTPEGGGIVALTRPETTLVEQLPSNVAPAWSPDGSRIVYVSNREGDEEAGAWRLWTMNADGSDKRQLPIEVPIDYVFAAEQVADWGPAVQ